MTTSAAPRRGAPPALPPTTGPVRRGSLAAAAGTMAVAGYAGAVGLLGGGIDFGPAITGRLPWHSPVVAGMALLAVVAAPMTVAAAAAWGGHRWAGPTGVVAGAALVGWIVVEVAVIRTYSWMQPFCAGYGLLVAALGGRAAAGRRASGAPRS